MDKYLVYITAENIEQARKIGNTLVEERLVACVNILPDMQSIYWWEGKVEESNEAAIIAKTIQANIEKIKLRVKELHSYDCPCIIAINIEDGNTEYLDWIENSVN